MARCAKRARLGVVARGNPYSDMSRVLKASKTKMSRLGWVVDGVGTAVVAWDRKGVVPNSVSSFRKSRRLMMGVTFVSFGKSLKSKVLCA